MKRMVATFIIMLIVWLALTYSLAADNLVIGAAVSAIITFISRHLLSKETPIIILHPMRWIGFIAYIGYMIYAETIAHFDVIKRIITGRIRPGIVAVPVDFDTHLGKMLFGNSITLTPGTLTVNVDKGDRFYVHTIGYSKDKEIGKEMKRFVKGVIR